MPDLGASALTGIRYVSAKIGDQSWISLLVFQWLRLDQRSVIVACCAQIWIRRKT